MFKKFGGYFSGYVRIYSDPSQAHPSQPLLVRGGGGWLKMLYVPIVVVIYS